MGGREVSRPYRVFRRRRVVFILLAMPPPSLERAALVMWCGWFKPQPQTKRTVPLVCGLWFAWNQSCRSTNDWCEALASLKGCFLCFCFSPPSIFPLNRCHIMLYSSYNNKRQHHHIGTALLFLSEGLIFRFILLLRRALLRLGGRRPRGGRRHLQRWESCLGFRCPWVCVVGSWR